MAQLIVEADLHHLRVLLIASEKRDRLEPPGNRRPRSKVTLDRIRVADPAAAAVLSLAAQALAQRLRVGLLPCTFERARSGFCASTPSAATTPQAAEVTSTSSTSATSSPRTSSEQLRMLGEVVAVAGHRTLRSRSRVGSGCAFGRSGAELEPGGRPAFRRDPAHRSGNRRSRKKAFALQSVERAMFAVN